MCAEVEDFIKIQRSIETGIILTMTIDTHTNTDVNTGLVELHRTKVTEREKFKLNFKELTR